MGPERSVTYTPTQGDRVSGKVALVAGGGSVAEGIGNGRAAAILLARHGAKVALMDTVPAAAERTAEIIREDGGTCLVIQGDVTDPESCEATVRKTCEAWGQLDVLLNNVGTSRVRGTAEDVNLDEWDMGLRVNVTSIVLMTRFAAPVMRRSGVGQSSI